VTYIDSALLNLTEWLCRKFQLLTGKTNVWLALQLTNLSIIVYFVWAGVVYSWSSDVASRIAFGLFCSALLYVLSQTIFKVPIEAYEESAYRRVAKGFRNPRRVRDALLRISFLTLSLVLFSPILFVYMNVSVYDLRVHIALLSYSLIVLTTVVLYLLACDPLPPCAGKVREWLRGSALARSREELPVDAVKVGGIEIRRRPFAVGAEEPLGIDGCRGLHRRRLRGRALRLFRRRAAVEEIEMVDERDRFDRKRGDDVLVVDLEQVVAVVGLALNREVRRAAVDDRVGAVEAADDKLVMHLVA